MPTSDEVKLESTRDVSEPGDVVSGGGEGSEGTALTMAVSIMTVLVDGSSFTAAAVVEEFSIVLERRLCSAE